jgi:hypothetical protein
VVKKALLGELGQNAAGVKKFHGRGAMIRFLSHPHILCCSILLSAAASAANAGPKDDLIAADKAFFAMSVAGGSGVAFLAYLADYDPATMSMISRITALRS